MTKALPIGIYDFKQIITENYYYVDKSLLIQELLKSRAAATLIPRPRRFGKTLNMSMLRYFFEKTEIDHAYLFEDLAVAQHPDLMKHQGQYPVIFLTLKFVEEPTWDTCLAKLKQTIAEQFKRFEYLIHSTVLNETEKKEFKKIISLTADDVVYKLSLKKLILYLTDYHKKRTIVLIDEYDVPMHAGYQNGYLNEVSYFMKAFFGDALKDNNKLEFAVVTGALRVARESIFTGWNNLEVCTFLTNLYADKFGLLENEVKRIITYYNINTDMHEVQSWYNGYTSGNYTLYNPWSIINFAKQEGSLKPYWINTSSNNIVKQLIKNGDDNVKENIEVLIAGGSITKPLAENIVYEDIKVNNNALWNFLFLSGYLTFKNNRLIHHHPHADFLIPNIEVRYFYESTILSWFEEQPGKKLYDQMLQSLITGDIELFKKIFSQFVHNSFSYFDISGEKAENFYHAFVLGMLISLSDKYEVKSNRESGFGRYDVMIIPRDISKIGIIIEFKKVDMYDNETLEEAAFNALKQIENQNYAQELHVRGITSIVKLGIAFAGKRALIKNSV